MEQAKIEGPLSNAKKEHDKIEIEKAKSLCFKIEPDLIWMPATLKDIEKN